ncbi:MAG: histidinol-phosphate transaminase [Gammaproteobacteria bacterium]|jgi:histidinol-phosphate aminotransferase|nr:histidinol-phosphate transaminase [Gammaproteobacteria bacterium]
MPGPDRFSALAAEGVLGLQPYVPGKPVSELEREYGIHDSIKLASNENPLGPPPASLRAIDAALADLALYPDGAAFELKAALAKHLAVDPAEITVGNGSNELLSLVAETFLTPATEAVHSQFAFLVYALSVQATGATARIAPANPPDHAQPLGHDLAAMKRLVGPATRLVFIANPNNPTGTWLGAAELRAFIGSLPPHVLVVLDEAYGEYVEGTDWPDTLRWLDEFPRLIITRTFSKMYALAGLRVGYSVSHREIAGLLNRVRQPFNVNSLAQVAARAALDDTVHVTRSRQLNAAGLGQLSAGLRALGWQPIPSAGNFVLVDTGGPALPWYEKLLRAGVIVRPVANYGLPNHLRITVGLPEQNERLLSALRSLMAGKTP